MDKLFKYANLDNCELITDEPHYAFISTLFNNFEKHY